MYVEEMLKAVRRNYNESSVECRQLSPQEVQRYGFAQNKAIAYFVLRSSDGKEYKLFCIQPSNDFIREIV